MAKKSILLVDDDQDCLDSLQRILNIKGIKENIFVATNKEESLKIFLREKPYVVILDLELNLAEGVESGYQLLKTFLKEDKTTKIIVLTGHGTSEYGIKAIKYGASNFLKKPADPDHLLALIEDGISQSSLLKELEKLKGKETDKELEKYIIGESNEIKKVREEILFAGQTNQPILISGETGSGKSLVAKAIHLFGKNPKNPFVSYQPNYSSDDLTNSDLFGHEKGAFTGADKDKVGLLELSCNGTFFLDEVSSLSSHTQASLLTALQEKKIRRIGSTKEISINFRLISATNEDVEQAINEKKLRLDFFHRIAHSMIFIPPLSKRSEDILPLSLFFINELSKKEDFFIIDIDKKALLKLKNYPWKGNIRELQAVIESASYRANYNRRRIIEDDDIILNNMQHSQNIQNSSLSFREKVLNYKKSLIKEALTLSNNNQANAAKALGIDRTTLRRILEEEEK